MADEDKGKRNAYLAFAGGVIVAIIAGVVSYVAATIQSEGAIKAALETANASNLTGYTVDKGIWVIGKGHRSIVYCEMPPSEMSKEIKDRRIYCTQSTYVLTY